MTEIDQKLAQEKKRLEEVKAPEELYGRLQQALDKTPKHKKILRPQWIAVAAALFFLSFIGYQYNAFAYYGKKLLGFEKIMPDTLVKLYEQGNGQDVDEIYVFHDDTKLQLESILTDENQLILYYTLNNPLGVKEDLSFMEIKGFLTNTFNHSGISTMNEQGTVLKGMKKFDPVSTFAKKLTLTFDRAEEQGEMTFAYDPRKAMQTILKQPIKKKIPVDRGSIRLDSIIATPSQTTIKGKFKVDNYDRIPLGFSGVKLVADGVGLPLIGGGSSSAFNGNTFTIDYDALPKNVKSLELVVDTFVGYKQLNQVTPLTTEQTTADLDGDELLISHVEIIEGNLQMKIATDENILLDGVSAQVGEKEMPLLTTLGQESIEKDGKQYKQRVIQFNGDQLPDKLIIAGLHYEKKYNEIVDIPIWKSSK